MSTPQVVWTTALLHECLEAGLVPSTRGDQPLFLSCTDDRDIDCNTCPLCVFQNCRTFTKEPFRDFTISNHPELLI